MNHIFIHLFIKTTLILVSMTEVGFAKTDSDTIEEATEYLKQDGDCAFIAFDVVFIDGVFIGREPLSKRLEILDSRIKPVPQKLFISKRERTTDPYV